MVMLLEFGWWEWEWDGILWNLFHIFSLLPLAVQMCKLVFRNGVLSIILVISSFWDTNAMHISLLSWTLTGKLMLQDTCTLKHSRFLYVNHFLFRKQHNEFLELDPVSICFFTCLLMIMYCIYTIPTACMPLSKKHRYMQTSTSQGFIATK